MCAIEEFLRVLYADRVELQAQGFEYTTAGNHMTGDRLCAVSGLMGINVQIADGAVNEVHIADAVREALVDIADETRTSDRTLQGISTRALVLMMPALQARAMTQGRDYVSADDVQALAPHVLSHRIMVAPGSGRQEDVVAECLAGPIERLSRGTLRR